MDVLHGKIHNRQLCKEKDESVDIALKQIKEKEYVQKFINENNEVLAVAICYDSKLKEHKCKIEKI